MAPRREQLGNINVDVEAIEATAGDVVVDFDTGSPTGLKVVKATDTQRAFYNGTGSDITLTGETDVILLADGLSVFAADPSVDLADAISPAADDAVGALGTSLEVAREDHKHPAQGVSADSNNELTLGTDGLHFFEQVNEVFSSVTPLTGVAPVGVEWGVDTVTGLTYHVSGGNWVPSPIVTVDQNLTVSNEAGNNGGPSPYNAPATPDVGDIHLEVYDDFLVWWAWNGITWVNSAQVATNPNAATGISPAADDATGAAGTAVTFAREDHKHPAQGVSADAEQLLKAGTDGLHMLDPDDMISADADNTLSKGTDGKLYASDTAFADAISPASDDATGAVGTTAEAAREDHKHPAQGVSVDANNSLTTGTDGLHFFTDVDEVIENAGALTGAAPAGAQWGVDTSTGQAYYVAGGNWTAMPISTIDLNFTVSSEAGNNAGAAPLNPPATPDVGDVHLEIYDDFLVWWSRGGAIWINSAQIETNPNAATAISPAADDATGAVGTSVAFAREDHKHPAQGVSADADNALTVGADGLHFYKSNAKAHVPDSSLTLADAGEPTAGEIDTYVAANTLSDIVLEYTGTDTATDPVTHVFIVDADGASTLVQAPSTIGLRGEPVADNATLTALEARDYERRKVLADGKEYVFELGAVSGSLADDAATGFWQEKIVSLEAIKIDSSAAAVTETLSASTNAGVVLLYINIDLTNAATLAVQPGETLNGATDGTFTFSDYDVGTQFRADEVAGGWVVNPVAVASQQLQKVRFTQKQTDGSILAPAARGDLVLANTEYAKGVTTFDPATASFTADRSGTFRAHIYASMQDTDDDFHFWVSVDGVDVGEHNFQGNGTDVEDDSYWRSGEFDVTVGQEVKVEWRGINGSTGDATGTDVGGVGDIIAVEIEQVTQVSVSQPDLVDIEQARVLLGSQADMVSNDSGAISQTWGSLAAEYERVEIELIGKAGALNIRQSLSLNTANWTDDVRCVFVSDEIGGASNVIVVRNMDIAGTTFNLFLSGTGVTQADVNIYGVKPQQNVIPVADTPVNDDTANGVTDIGTMRIITGEYTLTGDAAQDINLTNGFAGAPLFFSATKQSTVAQNEGESNISWSPTESTGTLIKINPANSQNNNGDIISYFAIGLKP